MVLPQAPSAAGAITPPCAAVVSCFSLWCDNGAADVSRINTTPSGRCDGEHPMSSTGPRTRPAAAAVRAARSAPALPLRSVAAAAGVTVDVAARQLRDLRFRAACGEIARAGLRRGGRSAAAVMSSRGVWAPAAARAARVPGAKKDWARRSRALPEAARALPLAGYHKLASDENHTVRETVAYMSRCPARALTQIAASQADGSEPWMAIQFFDPSNEETQMGSDAKARLVAARNRACPTAALVVLASDRLPVVRHAAACNAACPPAALAALAGDDHPYVRSGVPRNAAAATVTLTALAGACSQDQPHTREIIGAHPRTSQRTLARLAEDPEPRVQAAVAENPSCSAALLEHLSGDTYTEVMRAARRNKKRRAEPTDGFRQRRTVGARAQRWRPTPRTR